MALQDFYGTYQVTTASGTEFGVESEVVIGQAVDGSVPVTFSSSSGEVALSGAYDDEADALRIPMRNGDQVMFVSRYVDSNPDYTYRSIYGIVINTNPAPGIRKYLPVWSAELLEAQTTNSSGNQEVSADALTSPDFVGDYFIWTTADSQFGVASRISITGPNASLVGEVTSALGTTVLSTGLYYDSETVSVFRAFTGTVMSAEGPVAVPVVFAMSVATEGETTYGYGIFTVGDPEQGGTFGGEEGGP